MPLIRQAQPNRLRPSRSDFEAKLSAAQRQLERIDDDDQRDLTQDVVLRAQVAMANRLIAEQSAAIARAHSAIERAMETLRGPDGRSDLSC